MSRFPKDSNLKRPYNKIPPKIEIYVLCEGDVTEPRYVKDFANHHANQMVKVYPIEGVGVPLTVVQQAVELKKDLLSQAKKSKDSFASAFSVWCMIDVDEHPNLKAAIDLAQGNKIPVCTSNPCFELWGMLHLKDQNAYIHRHKLQKDLSKEMPKYHHKNNPILDYKLIKDLYGEAKRRAEIICASRQEEGKEGCNPSTNLYKLLDYIISNSKSKKA